MKRLLTVLTLTLPTLSATEVSYSKIYATDPISEEIYDREYDKEVVDLYRPLIERILSNENPINAKLLNFLNLLLPFCSDDDITDLIGVMSEEKFYELRLLIRWPEYTQDNFDDITNFPLVRIYACSGNCFAQKILVSFYIARQEYHLAGEWLIRLGKNKFGKRFRYLLREYNIYHPLIIENRTDEEVMKIFLANFKH